MTLEHCFKVRRGRRIRLGSLKSVWIQHSFIKMWYVSSRHLISSYSLEADLCILVGWPNTTFGGAVHYQPDSLITSVLLKGNGAAWMDPN
jgi:hypothetical protein